MFGRILAICMAFMLAACANTSLAPKKIDATNLAPDHGILIGSFSRNPSAAQYTSQTIYFRNLDTQKTYSIHSQQAFSLNGRTFDQFKEPGNSGATFALEVPAGRYVIYNYKLYQAYGAIGYSAFTSKSDFAIPFEVVAGAANYLGQFKLEGSTGRNIFGMKLPAGGMWFVSNQLSRDTALLKKNMPNLPLSNLRQTIPTKKDIFTPLIVLPNETDTALSS